MTDLCAVRWARGFALLIQPWPSPVKYPKPSRIVMARLLGQLELFPIEKSKQPAYQLQLPLAGGYWDLVERPGVVSAEPICIRATAMSLPVG
jgi:hypothetical protein